MEDHEMYRMFTKKHLRARERMRKKDKQQELEYSNFGVKFLSVKPDKI